MCMSALAGHSEVASNAVHSPPSLAHVLQVLGGGLDVVTVGARTYIRSVPVELNTDTNKVLELAEVREAAQTGIATPFRVCSITMPTVATYKARGNGNEDVWYYE